MLKETEIEKLIVSMTLKEKIGQINQPHYGWKLWKKVGQDFQLTSEFQEFIHEYGGVGAIYGLLRTDPWTKINFENGFNDGEQVKIIGLVQDYLQKNTRLKIPALITEETPHGLVSLYAQSYPPNISIGASFDLKTYQKILNHLKLELMKNQVNLALFSGLDIPFDKRWGRTEECFGEDPYLSQRFNKAMVETIQKEQKIGVVLKHFLGYGASLEGKNGLNANIGLRELEQLHLPPTLGAIDAQVSGVMVAYNEIDGVPCITNQWLLQEILRKKLNFAGLIMGDGLAIDGLQTKLIDDSLVVASLALKAGINLSLWDKSFLQLDKALKKGLISEQEIDQAVRYVLKLKNNLGLFDNAKKTKISLSQEKMVFDNAKMAASGSVLLKNENQILPLKKCKQNVLVVSDFADDIYAQLGDYTSFQDLKKVTTYRQGLEKVGKKLNWKMNFVDFNFNNQVKDYDLVIVIVGDSSKRNFATTFAENGAVQISSKTKSMTSGEGVDLHDLNLPSHQLAFFEKIQHSQIITVFNIAKPHVLTLIEQKSQVLLNMWYPGGQGGEALVKILLGEWEPSGRLNHTFPRFNNLNTLRYNDKNLGESQYFDLPKSEILYEFGFGLGYGKPCQIKIGSRVGNQLNLKLTNPNNHPREEVLLIFKKTRNSFLTQRKKELVYFTKISLKAQETQKIVCQWQSQNKNLLVDSPVEKYLEESFYLNNGQETWKIN